MQSMMIVPDCFITVKLPFVEEKACSSVSLCHFWTVMVVPPISFDEDDCF